MGSRIKSLFGQSSSNNDQFKSNSYDSATPQEPPIRGSYPVAGNGHIDLIDIQRARASQGHSRAKSASADSVRQRQDVERPRTAPNGGGPAGGYVSAVVGHERTRSGFSMKTPPNFRSLNPIEQVPPIPHMPVRRELLPQRDVKVYQPKRGTSHSSINALPRPQDNVTPRKLYVDLLDARSSIGPRDVPGHRIQASGSRNYGEDVADRNISMWSKNKSAEQENVWPARSSSRLDVNSPELSYLKTMYSYGKRTTVDSIDSRAASALGHVLDRDSDITPSDDIQPRSPRTNNVNWAGSQTDPIQTKESTPNQSRSIDDADHSCRIPDGRGRAFSAVSGASSQLSFISRRSISTSGKTRRFLKEPPPVPPPANLPRKISTTHIRDQSGSTIQAISIHERNTSTSTVKHRPHAMSTTSTIVPPAKQDSPQHTPRSFPLNTKPKEMLVEGAKEAPNLDGIVDLTNTVHTDVTTTVLPAVTHENVHRETRNIIREVITREIHYHDVYHRVLPVIETEILPTKHYRKNEDGTLVEMAASEVPNHEPTWKLEATRPHRQQSLSHKKGTSDLHNTAETPVLSTNRKRSSSMIGTSQPTIEAPQPILTSQKTYTTKEGFPRTEYDWYHPPVFEDMHGRTQPAFIATGLPDIQSLQSPVSTFTQYIDESQNGEAEEGLLYRDSGYGSGMLPGLGVNSPMAGFEGQNKGPNAGDPTPRRLVEYSSGQNTETPASVAHEDLAHPPESLKLGRVINQDRPHTPEKEGTATKLFRKLRGRRQSSVTDAAVSSGSPRKSSDMKGVESGMSKMTIKH